MKEVGSGSESSSSVPSKGDHRPATLKPSATIPTVEGIVLDWKDTAAIWNNVKVGEKELEYGDESSVRDYVRLVLKDIAASLHATLKGHFKFSFWSELSTFGDSGDLWVVCAKGMAVGVVEVKKPGRQAMTKETILGECFDYMQDVRGFDGQNNIFCILTTYQEWRILWFEDSDNAARSTKMPEVPDPAPRKKDMLDKLLGKELPPFPSFGATGTSVVAAEMSPYKPLSDDSQQKPQQQRVVVGSPVLGRGDQRLIPAIASVLVKMALSPFGNHLLKAADLDRQYREVRSDSWVWKRLTREFALQFDLMPNCNTQKYILLMPLVQGEHGITWLASSESGLACVIKFQKTSNIPRVLSEEQKLATTESETRHIEREAGLWRAIWDAEGARVVPLVGKHVLIMPFVRTCVGQVGDQTPETKELAKAAVERMAVRGYRHRDLRWERVGLYRRGNSNEKAAVLIDLGDVEEFDRAQKTLVEAAKKTMLDDLKL